LLIAVDRTVPEVLTESVRPDENWSLVLQVFGYPRVMNRAGEVAHFEKKRALELVTWMALNRERSRRSAARTAMWDDDVADATFSTVVSAMRRGLGAIDNSITATDWAPPTYSDELLLNSQITTDENLIAHSLRQFRADARELGGLMAYLPWVRDVPFAGTAYSWADLDGTTTRLVILALTASREVATWAVEHGDMEALGVAVSAGLRVMPGDEELLGLQSSFLQTVREAGAHSVA
jgi:two-component SAPR family response regulator